MFCLVVVILFLDLWFFKYFVIDDDVCNKEIMFYKLINVVIFLIDLISIVNVYVCIVV